MQVSPNMYGSPANCITCKQKLFIPEAHEIEEGTKIIYLKDRRELLRKPGVYTRDDLQTTPPLPPVQKHNLLQMSSVGVVLTSPSRAEAKGEPSDEELFFQDTNVTPGTIDRQIRLDTEVPLDPYIPLQRWAGFKNALDSARNSDDSGDKKELYNKIEKDLEEVLETIQEGIAQELYDAQAHLEEVEEEIGGFLESLAESEISQSYFHQQVDSLRTQREVLARHIYSLTQWSTYAPDSLLYPAESLSLDEFEKDRFITTHNFADFETPSLPLSDYYCKQLEKAFDKKYSCKKEVDSEKHILPDDSVLNSEATARLSLVLCEIHFIRTRLQQLIDDCDNDFQALINSQIKILSVQDQSKAEWRKVRGNVLDLQAESKRQLALKDKLTAYHDANSLDTLELEREEAEVHEEPSTFPFVQILALSLAAFALLGYFFLLLPSEKDIPFTLAVFPSLLLLGHSCLSWLYDAARKTFPLLLFWALELAVLVGGYFYLQNNAYLAPMGSPDFDALSHVLFLSGVSLMIGGNASEFIGNIASPSRESLFFRFLTFLLVTLLAALFFLQLPNWLSSNDTFPLLSESNPVLIDDESYSPPDVVAPHSRGYSELTIEENLLPEEDPDQANFEDFDDEYYDFADTRHQEPQLYLNGVVHADGKEPRFRATLRMPDGSEEDLTLLLGEVVLGDWVASEYNPSKKRLTLSDGQKMLALQAGKTVSLPANAQEAN
ncbi:MAG: hypothetical protein GX130_11050 [Candidatus Hydrogenedens sp.]|nr:hypothetical protein [Candidatus Hydrogenedens sp.]